MRKTFFVLAFLLLTIPVVSAKASAAETVHNVVKGDTLWEMSVDYKVSLDDIRRANDKWDDLILIGQKIIIPTEGSKTAVSAKSKQIVRQNSKTVQTQKVSSSTSSSVSSYEKDLLARLVRAEAESEPYSGKVEVAKVVLNRVASSKFPNSIQGVIYQSGQFSPVSNGSINRSADSESVQAVNEAISIGGQANGALYFYNPNTSTSSWVFSRATISQIGNHVFAR